MSLLAPSHPQNAVVSVHVEACVALAARYDAMDLAVSMSVSETLNRVCILLLYGIKYTFSGLVYLLRCEGVCVNVRRS